MPGLLCCGCFFFFFFFNVPCGKDGFCFCVVCDNGDNGVDEVEGEIDAGVTGIDMRLSNRLGGCPSIGDGYIPAYCVGYCCPCCAYEFDIDLSRAERIATLAVRYASNLLLKSGLPVCKCAAG